MAFSKSFPKQIPNSPPVWEEIILTEQEEQQAEESCRKENFRLLDESLQDARMLAIKNGINTEETQTALAIALFEKRASHSVFWKENMAKEKFDKIFKH